MRFGLIPPKGTYTVIGVYNDSCDNKANIGKKFFADTVHTATEVGEIFVNAFIHELGPSAPCCSFYCSYDTYNVQKSFIENERADDETSIAYMFKVAIEAALMARCDKTLVGKDVIILTHSDTDWYVSWTPNI